MPEAQCVVCGCTESRACVYGCSWASVDPPVCDRCDGGEPFNPYVDEDGWHVVSAGPFGTDRVMMVHLGKDASEADATREAAALNEAYSRGVRAGARITSKLAARKIARMQKRQGPRRGARARSS